MPAAGFSNQASGVASGAASVTSGTLVRNGGLPAGVYALVAYNGDFSSNPATAAVFGGEPLAFLFGRLSNVGNVSVEIWGAQVTGDSATVTVGFAGGTVQDMGLSVIEVERNGSTVAGQTSGTAGTTSPLTDSITAVAYNAGRQGTVIVPETDQLLIGIGCMFKAGSLSNLTLSDGTSVQAPTNVGAGGTLIQFATAYKQATGGSDAISWTESLDREWVEAMAEVVGATVPGMVKCQGVVPGLV